VAGVEHEQPPLGDHLEVQSQQQTAETDPEADLLCQVDLHLAHGNFAIDQRAPPPPHYVDRQQAEEEGNRPVIQRWDLVIAVLTPELSYPRISNPRSKVLVEYLHT
jgi:hypothetical protein